MRLIDADALISHLNDYALQEAPIYGRHQNDSSYDAIQNCIKAVEECKSVDCVQEIKRQVKNVHQDLSGHEPYKTERWFKIGLDLMYDQVMDIIKHMAAKETGWIPVAEKLPKSGNYVLMSFENFVLPAIGRYEVNDEGDGAWYLGDDDEGDTCCSVGLFVNAWMPLPEPYQEE